MTMYCRLLTILGVLLAGVSTATEEITSRTVLGLDPNLAAGTEAMQAGDFEEGVRLTLKGLPFAGTDKNRAAAYSNLCAGFAKTRRYEEAADYCNRSLELRPQNWRALHNRAYVRIMQGRLDEAVQDATAGLEIAPEAAVLHEVLEIAERLQRKPTVIMDQFPRDTDS